MKKTLKILGIIALVAVVGFSMAACSKKGPVAPVGSYSLDALKTWTITFGQGTFSMFVPAQVSPTGADSTANGNFTISGNTLTLTGLQQPMTFTITNATTLTESDGSVWNKK